jgi:hypothetical protein
MTPLVEPSLDEQTLSRFLGSDHPCQAPRNPRERATMVRRRVERVGFVYSAGWAGGAAAIIGMLDGRDICMAFTTLRETNDGKGGPLAR